MKSFIKAIIFTVMVLIGSTASVVFADSNSKNQATTSQGIIPVKKDVHVLFTQTASSATIKPNGKKDWYTLTLNNINPDVLWFSDRPNRLSGDIEMNKFIKYWYEVKDKESYVKDHPNADLIGASGDDKIRAVFMLTDPVYNASQKTLTYQVYHIAGSGNFSDKISSLQNVALFIDTAADCQWCPW